MAGRKGQLSGPKSPEALAAASKRMSRMHSDPELSARRRASVAATNRRRWQEADTAARERHVAGLRAWRAERDLAGSGLTTTEQVGLYYLARRNKYGRAEAIQFAQAQASAQTAGGSLPPPPASGRADDDALRVANQSAGPAAPSFDGEPRR